MACVGKQTLTPKAIIHQKFGTTASYTVEEVHDSAEKGCPGLKIPQKGPCLYRCHLQLPDFEVLSNVFRKKKDAEQSAAEMALEKLGIRPRNDNLTVDEAWDDIVGRIKHIFSDEFLSSDHPLGSHVRAALRRDGDLSGSVPVSVIAAFDSKINSRCKTVNPLVDSDPFLVISYVFKAAEKLPDFIIASPAAASIKRSDAYPSEILEALATQVSDSSESIKIEAVHIPCNLEEDVEPVTLDISSGQYYLDVIAEKLGLKDGNHILISRMVGRSSSDTRLYSAIPKWKSLDISSKASGPSNDEEESSKKYRNARASYVCGQDIYGDAIMASVGYTWKSHNLHCNDVTLTSYYRICLGMSPNGIYKISRQAILTAQLPSSFITTTNWRGSFPREILSMFCRQNQLAEPVFSTSTTPLSSVSDILRSHKKMKLSDLLEPEASSDRKTEDLPGSENRYRCEVKVLTKSQDLILECSHRKFYKKQNDSIQSASLKVLLWFNRLFDDIDADPDELEASIIDEDIKFHRHNFLKETCSGARTSDFHRVSMPFTETSQCVESETNGSDSGVYPSSGSMVCLCYSVSLVTNGEFAKELIESNEEIEFEVGTGAMVPSLESVVTQMSVGQHAVFASSLLAQESILAAASADTVRTRSLLSSESSYLEYSILLLGVKVPPEERMEEAFFSPPLSKQRVEYALKHIKESSAANLVDFGCGSGSLLNSLLDYPTSLETIVGVDISPKGLARAAKMLHSKLNTGANDFKSAKLYEGSIIEFDSRLHDFDIGTCLEVIEHMEEEQACQFGDMVLSSFCPKLLIVSTPNYEYNSILQRSIPESQEEDPEDKSSSQLPRFRNHDHKFEWTREQFNHWASELARRHHYSVEFSGVGGSGDVEPGFASQIAVFRQGSVLTGEEDDVSKGKKKVRPYSLIWKWDREDGDKTIPLEEEQ
ncbi:PREDICTED: small RNA 2'-O-methyltransferase [Tarenaya hassleriana]|uniref:small RNA 2'-O-methyltransferase n=1 Tax=Tarenaya hassleriana TaxID=28532 RepID=UPI00053C9D78|nr:PREDICTED: small RNA 2'-O-methyltransferase [Tarenaya hassleriana]